MSGNENQISPLELVKDTIHTGYKMALEIESFIYIAHKINNDEMHAHEITRFPTGFCESGGRVVYKQELIDYLEKLEIGQFLKDRIMLGLKHRLFCINGDNNDSEDFSDII